MNKKKLFYPADVLLPKQDFESFSVIACDQYTSEPEYWQAVKNFVGDKKSALNIILPEVYLSDNDDEKLPTVVNAGIKYISSKLILLLIKSIFNFKTVLSQQLKFCKIFLFCLLFTNYLLKKILFYDKLYL